jgi:hypothetical protein
MALTPTYDRRNVLTGMAAMFLKTVDPEEPAELPPNTLALGAAWPTPWSPPGATTEGLTFGFSRDSNDITIEEQPSPVDTRTNGLEFTMDCTLSEDTIETMRIAYGGGIVTTVAATTTLHGYQDLKISSEMEDFAFGFEGENQFGLARRVVVPVVKSVGDIQTAYRRADSQRAYEVSFKSLVSLDDVLIRNITALPTGP